jgi:hypothetical protein
MTRHIVLRFALPLIVSATLFPSAMLAQSQDTQSVAEAARRAREQKKTSPKPAKLITDDTLEVKKGDVQSAVAEQLKVPGSPDAGPAAGTTNAQAGAATGAAITPGSENASAEEKARATLRERVALKEKIKDAESDLDLLQREYKLDQDSYYSNTNYASDTAGKEKLDALKQQVTDKQQELEKLKARLAALPPETAATTPKS